MSDLKKKVTRRYISFNTSLMNTAAYPYVDMSAVEKVKQKQTID